MTGLVGDDYVSWVWDEQSRWSQRGNDLRDEITRNRGRMLVLVAAAAVLATASAPLAELTPWAGRVAVIGALVAGAVAARLRSSIDRTRVGVWTRTRSVSESLKMLTYSYLAGVGPYRGADARAELEKAVDALLASAGSLVAEASTKTAVVRDLPPVHGVADYLVERVERQRVGYYAKQAGIMAAKADRFSRLESMLFYVGAALSAVVLVFPGPWLAPWVAVLTTIAAAIAAHAAVQRYGTLQLEYAQAAHELGRLLSGRRPTAALTPEQAQAQDDAFVAAAESVISNQNETWMANSLEASEKGDAAIQAAIATAKQEAEGRALP
jgi:hypothetical protein